MKEATLPFVSVIVPCRNEERFIASCLDSIVASDYPKERLEVLVVDGMSEDDTRRIVETYAQRYPFILLIPNPKRIIPSAMNIAIHHARGDIILKIDAHSIYASDYIRKCITALQEYGADNVGGRVVHTPGANTLTAKAVASALSHPFGSLNSYFRTGASQPRWVDTTAFGCYPRKVFERVGLYREDLVRSSDLDLNRRLLQSGGRILLVPDAVIYYRCDASLWRFWRHNLSDGFWATYPLKFGAVLRWRHYAPIFLLSLFLALVGLAVWKPVLGVFPGGMLGVYGGISLWVSAKKAVQERRWGYIIALPLAFAVRHAGYGLGSIAGLLGAIASRDFWVRWLLRTLTARRKDIIHDPR